MSMEHVLTTLPLLMKGSMKLINISGRNSHGTSHQSLPASADFKENPLFLLYLDTKSLSPISPLRLCI